MLSRKHFKAAADILATVKSDPVRRLLVEQFSRYFRSENSRFDSDRFKRACEIEASKRSATIAKSEERVDCLTKLVSFSWLSHLLHSHKEQ